MITQINIAEDTVTEMPVTSGIRQGCTGPARLQTYYLFNNSRGGRKGFNSRDLNVSLLFYADDSLQLSHSLQDASINIRTLI